MFVFHFKRIAALLLPGSLGAVNLRMLFESAKLLFGNIMKLHWFTTFNRYDTIWISQTGFKPDCIKSLFHSYFKRTMKVLKCLVIWTIHIKVSTFYVQGNAYIYVVDSWWAYQGPSSYHWIKRALVSFSDHRGECFFLRYNSWLALWTPHTSDYWWFIRLYMQHLVPEQAMAPHVKVCGYLIDVEI